MYTVKGRRRIFKSGPAEETIESRNHDKAESTRGGLFPFSLGGFGVTQKIFFEF